ncbi:hypothetical protein DPEC_G00038330 [Dallia pectoralis]|uniref:Uncharacterized protein n=1 Tax=Dallia pectoralis TaxID=75939 RepID=A0ACC2HEA7_DALPE|nr:hypothetical protein DPEC_G00038330 [Dallia pectoralis]
MGILTILIDFARNQPLMKFITPICAAGSTRHVDLNAKQAPTSSTRSLKVHSSPPMHVEVHRPMGVWVQRQTLRVPNQKGSCENREQQIGKRRVELIEKRSRALCL